MPIKFQETKMKGVFIIKPHIYEDERGYFLKYFEKEAFEKYSLPSLFYESNESKSKRGTLRGLHFQESNSQGKLVRVIKGRVIDVIVDLRLESKTYGEFLSFDLSEENKYALFVPQGFAHGFLTLNEETIFSYLCTNKYAPEHDSGILWNDHTLNIPWNDLSDLEVGDFICSEKDNNLQTFEDFNRKYKGFDGDEVIRKK